MPVETAEFLGMPAVFASPQMRRAMDLIRAVAQTDASILILGESGSGKEVLARAVHHYSLRSSKPWVDISCAALPEHLVESELFGYEKGAFSGAQNRKPGMFELADSGTLFLDEAGELEPRLQVKLLRVLDTGEYYRLGGTKKIKVDTRVVVATNRDLRREVEEGRFRSDLYYRLAQLMIEVPPLRKRQEDIIPIARLFLEKYRPGARFSATAEHALTIHHWPGNVRQLKNVVMASVALTQGSLIDLAGLPPELMAGAIPPRDRDTAKPAEPALSDAHDNEAADEGESGALEALERNLILKVLDNTNGHQEKAARILGISSRTLHRKLKQYRQSERKEQTSMPVTRGYSHVSGY